MSQLKHAAFDEVNPVDPQHEEKRNALEKAIEDRHNKMLSEREKAHDKRYENTIMLKKVLGELDDCECDLKTSFDGLNEKVAAGASQSEISEALDEICLKINDIEKFIARHASAIPMHKVKVAHAKLNEQKELLKEKEASLQPKKKFGFKGKKSRKADHSKENPSATATSLPSQAQSNLGFSGYEVKDQVDVVIKISSSDVSSKDVLLSNLRGCRVEIKGNPSTLHMTHIEKCTLLSGPVSTSVFLEDAADCKFALACQQLRTHKTKRSDFSLHVTSRAIIEDCSEVRFAPYSLDYEDIADHFSQSGLLKDANNWDKVDDFNWLASNAHSPNWSLVPEHERETYKM